MATVQRVFVLPENDHAQQTDKESSMLFIYRVIFDPSAGLPFPYEGYGASDGTTTVPEYGDELEIDGGLTGLFANNINPQRTDGANPHVIDVYVTFSSLSSTPTPGEKWNVNIKSSWQESTETVSRYADGSLITTSAGRVYDPLPTKTYYDEVFTVTYSCSSLDADGLAAAQGKVGTDSVTMTVKGISRTFAPYTLKLKADWDIDQTGGAGTLTTFTSYKVNLQLIYRTDTWKRKLVDQGMVDSNGRPFTDKDGNPVQSPVYMDGAGGKLNTTTTTTAVFVIPAGNLIEESTAILPFLTGIA